MKKNYCGHACRPCVGGAWDDGDGLGVDCAQGVREKCPYLRADEEEEEEEE